MQVIMLAACAAMSPPRSPLWSASIGRKMAGATLEMGYIFGGAYALREYVADARHIPSQSMDPTFEVGDLFLLDKLSIRWRVSARGDVVCFRPPPALVALVPEMADILARSGRRSTGICAIKRIVGLPGDKVCVRRGKLFVNGLPADEPYLADGYNINYRMKPVRVPAGHVFVLGDNRNDSYDSHVWGCLSTDAILGRPLCTYWPPQRWRGRRAYRGLAGRRPTRFGSVTTA